MSFFLDANVLIYSAVDSEYRVPCLEILEAVAGRRAEARISTAVFEEVWHIESSGRAGRIGGLAARSYTLFTPLLPVTDEVVARALALDAPRLGTNDRIHAATALVNGIATVVSADAGFEGVSGIRRVDPRDERALHHLIGS